LLDLGALMLHLSLLLDLGPLMLDLDLMLDLGALVLHLGDLTGDSDPHPAAAGQASPFERLEAKAATGGMGGSRQATPGANEGLQRQHGCTSTRR
jgi:hypothetical protein